MKRLGVVENVAYDGSVLIRSEFAPGLGVHVVDRRQHPLGRVVKVFGPVSAPFAAVRPVAKVPLSLLGSDVYVGENNAQQESRRGRRSHQVPRVQ